MIDNFKIRLFINSPEEVLRGVNRTIYLLGRNFDPVIRNGIVIRYISKLENLYLTIREDELIIQNSMTKYYYGNNYSNLSYSELQQAICNIENALGMPIRNARVSNFEFGVAIEDNNIPWTLSRLGHYKGKQPLPMHANGAVYGAFYENTTHRLKLYDKTSEINRREGIKLDKNILRVEKFYSNAHLKSLTCFSQNPIITLDDLCSWKTLEILAMDLINSLIKIELSPFPDNLLQLSSMNLRRWCYFQDPFFRNIMKKYHPKAFKTDRNEINKIIQLYRQNGNDLMMEQVKINLSNCLESWID